MVGLRDKLSVLFVTGFIYQDGEEQRDPHGASQESPGGSACGAPSQTLCTSRSSGLRQPGTQRAKRRRCRLRAIPREIDRVLFKLSGRQTSTKLHSLSSFNSSISQLKTLSKPVTKVNF